ncbi:hypothetical protein E1091_08935 [Micromonospora fluostatini]|uniref:Uncharacterized protein n=1 Tax=Micromonospora fluostatini TaxID=1629071 RepID=A0ABY2DI51_9ACTN|nr:hypothetical protein E1091_08935 [Micromonospora fluostatini]
MTVYDGLLAVRPSVAVARTLQVTAEARSRPTVARADEPSTVMAWLDGAPPAGVQRTCASSNAALPVARTTRL